MEMLRTKSFSLYDGQIAWLEQEARRLNKKSASLLLREWIEAKRAPKRKKAKTS